jgi:hypothetical protein
MAGTWQSLIGEQGTRVNILVQWNMSDMRYLGATDEGVVNMTCSVSVTNQVNVRQCLYSACALTAL